MLKEYRYRWNIEREKKESNTEETVDSYLHIFEILKHKCKLSDINDEPQISF